MNFLDEYSNEYDLLYSDKNYLEESKFIVKILKKYNRNVKSILDFGCGSGKHAIHFAENNFKVIGIDTSKQMINRALSNQNSLPPDIKDRIKFYHCDINYFETNIKFDAVISLFHVFSYQNKDKEVENILSKVRNILKPGGLFVFDYWFAPAVLNILPSVRVKRVSGKNKLITRIAEPEMILNDNLVTVNYTIFVENKNNCEIKIFEEKHSMRYFFQREINKFATAHNFKLMETKEWLSENEPSLNSWSVYSVFLK